MRDPFLDIISKIVYQVTGRTGITYDTDFVRDLGFSSFDIMNVVCVFEEKFNIEVPTRDVWQLQQVQDVIAYMKSHGITEIPE